MEAGADSAPLESAPLESAPLESAPLESAPLESAPLESAPLESALAAAIRVMDQLRSPGGCPWDAQQTHESLAKYLLEESYETLDAIASNDLIALREELGDLLLQVLFHSRLAEEADPTLRFGIEDVAADLVAKLVRRHPHVFADVVAESADEVNQNWDQIKAAEKQRESVTDGIPTAQPALALAAKLRTRSRKLSANRVEPADVTSDDIGSRLFTLAIEAADAGVDPELAVRDVALRYREAIRKSEATAPDRGLSDQGGQ